MTIRQLILDLQELNPDWEVLIAEDPEGNDFNPMNEISFAEIDDDEEPDFQSETPNAIVFWP